MSEIGLEDITPCPWCNGINVSFSNGKFVHSMRSEYIGIMCDDCGIKSPEVESSEMFKIFPDRTVLALRNCYLMAAVFWNARGKSEDFFQLPKNSEDYIPKYMGEPGFKVPELENIRYSFLSKGRYLMYIRKNALIGIIEPCAGGFVVEMLPKLKVEGFYLGWEEDACSVATGNSLGKAKELADMFANDGRFKKQKGLR